MDFKNSIGYLLHHLAFVLDADSDQVLQERLGLGFAQFKILLVLESREGISQKQIADQLSQTEASISRQIRLLSQKGFVEIEKSRASKREKIVYLTQNGQAMANRAIEILNNYHLPLFESLEGKQQEELANTLKTLSETLGK
jgi:DNA-binding MarR family transcriptional regulator